MSEPSLRPDASVQKILISTPSRLVGELDGGFYLIAHAWPDFSSRNMHARMDEGPSSRSAYVFAFRTPEPDKKDVVIPNYSFIGPMICSYLAVIYGKRFDAHGLMEGSGYFNVPEQSYYSKICNHRLPFNSHSPRNDLKIDLNLVEAKVLIPLIGDDHVEDVKFVRTFQSAAKFYLQALQNFEVDAEVAYLHLITAIEVLSSFYEFDERELIDEELIKALDRVRTELEGGDKIANAVRAKIYSVRKRFLKTVVRLLTQKFYEGSEADRDFEKLKPNDIEMRILAAYDLRSRYVHTGAPFGSWIDSPARGEIQVGKPVVEDKDYGKILHRAPTFLGLERVVRYCLLRFLHTNGVLIRDELGDDV